tara:strand:+ start:1792 stop:1992 length:201 start_codon:yes stop_codon:yes gene_type:complete
VFTEHPPHVTAYIETPHPNIWVATNIDRFPLWAELVLEVNEAAKAEELVAKCGVVEGVEDPAEVEW